MGGQRCSQQRARGPVEQRSCTRPSASASSTTGAGCSRAHSHTIFARGQPAAPRAAPTGANARTGGAEAGSHAPACRGQPPVAARQQFCCWRADAPHHCICRGAHCGDHKAASGDTHETAAEASVHDQASLVGHVQPAALLPCSCLLHLQDALFTRGAPLHLLGDVCAMVGDMVIPSLMLLLGANLAKGAAQAHSARKRSS